MITDPIADYLTRIRNAIKAKHRIVSIPSSKLKKKITEVLYQEGYIDNFKFEDDTVQGIIKIALKYDPKTKEPAIIKIQRISSPGHRRYVGVDNLPRVLNGLGIAIMNTNKGVMTNKAARGLKVGGEEICHVY